MKTSAEELSFSVGRDGTAAERLLKRSGKYSNVSVSVKHRQRSLTTAAGEGISCQNPDTWGRKRAGRRWPKIQDIRNPTCSVSGSWVPALRPSLCWFGK